MNKAKLNYWIDLVIALAFVLSAASGIVFLFPPGQTTALGVSYRIWDQIHIWGSLLMIAGVLAHLVLHWKWIVAMTKKTFLPAAGPRHAAANDGVLASRRQFVRAAGMGTIALGAVAVGYRSLFRSGAAGISQAAADAGAVQPIAASGPATTGATQGISIPQAAQSTATTIPLTEVTAQGASAYEPILVPTSTPTAEAAAQSSSAAQSASVPQSSRRLTVACPKGLAYDAYPGQCRHYVDRDGDGYCDYSIPTAT